MSTTKFQAPNMEIPRVMKDGIMIVDPEYEKEQKRLSALNTYFDRTSIFRSFNFIKSQYGEIRYLTKRGLHNSMKTHCIESCYTDSTLNILQSEKLCMINCLQEAEAMHDGFLKFKHDEYNNEQSQFEMDKSVRIKKI